MSRGKIIMLKGLPASGKSTWARNQVVNGDGKIKRVNKDELRAMIDAGIHSKESEKKILEVRDFIINLHLEEGRTVIVDDTNFAPHHEKTLRDLAKTWDADFEEKFFDTPLEECLIRDSKREKPVGAKVIRGMYAQFLKKAEPVVKIDPTLPHCIIVDVDGTLAEMHGRSPYDHDEAKYYEDTVHDHIVRIAGHWEDMTDAALIIMSGREDKFRAITLKWLADKCQISPKAIVMRKTGDHRADYIVKKELYEEHIKGKYNVDFILDDRDQVVRMWRDQGLKCLQVADGNF